MGYNKILSNIDLRVSCSCNLHCDQCCMGNSLTNDKIDYDAIRDMFYKNPHIKEVHLGGGEPFFSDENAYEIYKLMKEFSHIKWKITTNLCYDLTPNRLLAIQTLDTIQTSFDIGIRFGNIRNLLKWRSNVRYILKNIRQDLDVICCLSKIVIQKDPRKLMRFFNKMGFFGYRYIPICESGNARKNPVSITREEFHEWMYKLLDIGDVEHNQTFDLIFNNSLTNCHYGTDCTPINRDGKPVHCGITERMYSNCITGYECLFCEDYQDCGGRCPLIPCLYNKDLYDKCKQLVIDKKRRGM